MALITDVFAYYKLDESSGDYLDAHASLTITDNGGAGTTTGKLNSCRTFDGSTQYGTRSDDASFSMGDVYFYAAGWFYTTSDGGTKCIFGKTNGTTAEEYTLRIQSYSFRFYVCSGSGFANQTVASHTATTILVNTWYFGECWHDPDANVIGACVNRGTDTTTSYTHGIWDSTNDFNFGREGSGGGRHWAGRLDEWYFRKGSLPTTGERDTLYGSGTPPGYDSFAGGTAGHPAMRRLGLVAGCRPVEIGREGAYIF